VLQQTAKRTDQTVKDHVIKTTMKFLTHPLTQIISFCLVIVGSDHYGAPFIVFLYHAVLELYLYAIVGWLALVVSSVALLSLPRKRTIQLIGLCLMICSLLIFFIGGKFNNAYSFNDLIPSITLLIFVITTFCFFTVYLRDRNY
jgi:hypothetical protein